MKEKILLVDGYNMIAFWQETRQLFKKSELEKRVAVVKADLNQARGAVNDQKPPIRPFDQEGLRQLQKEMGASK